LKILNDMVMLAA